MLPDVVNFDVDVLVIGAGGAGARAALEAGLTGVDVALVCRTPMGRGGATPTGNGGFHAAMTEGDSPEKHAEDLISLGCRINDRDLVRVVTEGAVQEAKFLESIGARVQWKIPPVPAEPEMRYPRSLTIPGREILRAIYQQIKKMRNVHLLEDVMALRILTGPDGAAGAVLWNIRESKLIICRSKTTVLATGSLGEIYPVTAQEPMGLPTGSTGGGYVMAALAGAELVDMEMTQFAFAPQKPTLGRNMRYLSLKAKKLNSEAKEFLSPKLGAYSHEAARGVMKEYNEGRGPVYIDLTGQPVPKAGAEITASFRDAKMREFAITPYVCPVNIHVGLLIMMGGVSIDENARTTLPNLFAAGEVSGNVHGARRVSGNSFPEITVMGAKAGKVAAADASKQGDLPQFDKYPLDEVRGIIDKYSGGEAAKPSSREIRNEIREIMGKEAHLTRSGAGLTSALERLSELEDLLPDIRTGALQSRYDTRILDAIDTRNTLKAAQIVCSSALAREESRGFHYRSDFPEEREEWLRHTMLKIIDGKIEVGSKPIRV